MMLHLLIVKILQKELLQIKRLRNRTFNIAKDKKYDGYQRELAYKFLYFLILYFYN